MCVCACGWVGGWGGCSCVICVFISVRKSCHFTTVFLVGRYFYLFALSLGLWIFFFFSIWAPFQYPWGRTEGSGPPTPRVQPPTPAHFFLPTPPPVFSLFFFRVPPPKIKILGDCSCVICVFFYVRKSCHFTTVFLVGRYFYLHVFTLSLGLWIFFFFSIWAPFQYPWGRTEGSGPPTPRVHPPTPTHFFPPYPSHRFFLIFLPGTPAQN